MTELLDKYNDEYIYKTKTQEEHRKLLFEKRLKELDKLEKEYPENKELYDLIRDDMKTENYKYDFIDKPFRYLSYNSEIINNIRNLHTNEITLEHMQLLNYLKNKDINNAKKLLQIIIKKENDDYEKNKLNQLKLKKKKEEENYKEIHKKINKSTELSNDDKKLIIELLKNKFNIKEDKETFDFYEYFHGLSKEIKEKIGYKKPWFNICFNNSFCICIAMINKDDEKEYNDKMKILEDCRELQDYINFCKSKNIRIEYKKEGTYMVLE